MSYVHRLDRSEPVLSDLHVGDEIQLLGCACFPGWSNIVEEAAIEIWGIDGLGEEQALDEQIPSPDPASETQDLTEELPKRDGNNVSDEIGCDGWKQEPMTMAYAMKQ